MSYATKSTHHLQAKNRFPFKNWPWTGPKIENRARKREKTTLFVVEEIGQKRLGAPTNTKAILPSLIFVILKKAAVIGLLSDNHTAWRVEVGITRGYQLSPFNDGTKTRSDFTITNLDNKETIKFSGLVPLMIERYGFYEGNGTPYRVEPADIIKVLGLNATAKSLDDGG